MTTLDAASTWAATLGQLELRVTRANYQTWLRDTIGLRFDGERMVVGAPNDFATEWLHAQMRGMVSRQLSEQLGRCVDVSFEVIRGEAADPPAALLPPAASNDEVPEFMRRTQAPPPNLHPALTFGTFVVGDENRLAHDAAQSLLALPGAVSPLLIFGSSGLGKTHLLTAIGHAARERGLGVVFATAERFGNDYVRARQDGYEAFRAKYRHCDVLIIDDVQFFEGRERFQEELFHTFNELHAAGKQVVFSADRPPSQLTGLGDALRSRLGWGLAADLQKPQFETRLAILRAKSRAHARPLPDDALVTLAERCCPTVRELEGWLNRVIAFAPLVPSTPAREVVSRALHPFAEAPEPPEPPCTDAIVNAVCQRTGATPSELRGRSRNRQVTYARHLSMYILKEDGEKTIADLARYFDRDHSSVISGIGRIQKELAVIPETVADVRAVREALAPPPAAELRRAG
jgi:chromosomal replication initiator protein